MSEKEKSLDAARIAVIQQIDTAFDGVNRKGGMTLHEADAYDWGLSDTERAKAVRRDTETRWQDVSAADIEQYHAVFCFLDSIGFHYYLPAYMVWTLKNYSVSDALMPHDAVQSNCEGCFALLTRPQAEAVCAFLRLMAEDTENSPNEYEAKQALEAYWGRFCPPLPC